MRIEIITGKQCTRCKHLESLLPKDERLIYIDQTHTDAQAILAFHELTHKTMTLPIVFIDDTLQRAQNIKVMAKIIIGELDNEH